MLIKTLEDADGNDANDHSDGSDYGHHRCDQHQVSYDELGTTLSDLYGIWQDGAESENRGVESAHKMTKSSEIGKLGEHVSQLEHVMEMWRDRAEDMRMERDELQEKNRHLAQKCDAMLVLLSNRAMNTTSDQEQRIEKLVRQRDELRVKLKEIGEIANG
jgi:chromosome segregation ATPase